VLVVVRGVEVVLVITTLGGKVSVFGRWFSSKRAIRFDSTYKRHTKRKVNNQEIKGDGGVKL